MSPSTDVAAELSAAIVAAVDSARAGDLDRYVAACGQFARLDLEVVGIVEAAAILSLLEEQHPDGLDADDVRALLTQCEWAADWLPDLDVDALLLVLTGALGAVDPDEQPATDRARLARHGTLVLAELTTARPSALADHLALAVAEIRRAETVELP